MGVGLGVCGGGGSGEGQRVKPMGILGDGALPKRW